MESVRAWNEPVPIPTYQVGPYEEIPVFLENRVYQGSSGKVYPYQVIETIGDRPEPKTYNAVFIENEYLKIMVLPELGGRIQMAYDKIKQRHFIYYNSVIKPALVGLAGPWVSGGIEINWPQHHRPSTFMPVEWEIEHLEDGGVTVWLSERERMSHQKGMAGYTLRPGIAYLELRGSVYNPTSVPQTFLWWANPAVHVNDHYQSVFPPDVNAVYDHGRRDVSTFPIATGTYYKMDYSRGVDISRYKNIPVPTSFMAVKSGYDFVGGYENDTRAGMLHVSDHNVSTGKKQWTWGCGDFGKAWDRNLTDSDGPYIELMVGMYCDNQPDFSWLMPFEEKTFTQYFMPYRELGVVKNACSSVMMNILEENSHTVLKLFATRDIRVRAEVRHESDVVLSKDFRMSPKDDVCCPVPGDPDPMECAVSVFDESGRLLLHWEREPEAAIIPSPAKPALKPSEVPSTEQLFLTGQHLEQYRHATFEPMDYYLEALRRDPGDIRNNNAAGLLSLRRGRLEEAETYFNTAIATLTERNANPYDGEPFFNLGLCLKYLGRNDKAYEAFYKACWNGAWQCAGYLELSRISVSEGKWLRALGEVDMSLSRGWHNLEARHLKALILRNLGMKDEALRLIGESVAQDRFNTGCLYEKWKITHAAEDLDHFRRIMGEESHNYMELSYDYISAGRYGDALDVLMLQPSLDMMSGFAVSYCTGRSGNVAAAAEAAAKAEKYPLANAFPNTVQDILVLEYVSSICDAPRALYLLGNIWYDKKQYQLAADCWEKSCRLDGGFPVVRRNLAISYYNKQGRKEDALAMMESAFAGDPKNARLFMELDQLNKKMRLAPSVRLDMLGSHPELIARRDDLLLEEITLLNVLGRCQDAKDLLDAHVFHPWEGGEGKVPAQYHFSRVELARMALGQGRWDEAITLLNECFVYPDNLGEGKLTGAREQDFNYYLGCAYDGRGERQQALEYWKKASEGDLKPASVLYYNDGKPEKIFYQALALRKLGKENAALEKFGALLDYGMQHLNDHIEKDYFAVSLPELAIWDENLDDRNRAFCLFLASMGKWGTGDVGEAVRMIKEALEMDPYNTGMLSVFNEITSAGL